MKNTDLIQRILFSFFLTVAGIFVQPLIELIEPDLFTETNLFISAFFIVLLGSVLNISFWTMLATENQSIKTSVDKILHEVQQHAELVARDQAYLTLAEWAKTAKQDVRILTYYDWGNAKNGILMFDEKLRLGDARKEWYAATEAAIRRSQDTTLKFVRIIQISTKKDMPSKSEISSLVKDLMQDDLQTRATKQLIELGKSQISQSSLRVSRVYTPQTFVLVDGVKLFIAFDVMMNHADQIYTSPFALIAEDSTGEKFQKLREMHEWIESKMSVLIEQVVEDNFDEVQ